MIGIIDYGVGNIRAFTNIFRQLNMPIKIAKRSHDLTGISKVILPGVGAFDYAMSRLQQSGMREPLDKLVLEHKVPVVGVCVGMQMFAKSSDEGQLPGLGWINGEVKKFEVSKIPFRTRLPHMGWNDVTSTKENALFKGLEHEAKFYFLHSYYFSCNTPDIAIAETTYGLPFTSAVNCDNIFGVQFHPEKSHHYGIKLLKNFAEL